MREEFAALPPGEAQANHDRAKARAGGALPVHRAELVRALHRELIRLKAAA